MMDLVIILSLRQERFVASLRMSFICSWQNCKQSFSSGSIWRKAADTNTGITFEASEKYNNL